MTRFGLEFIRDNFLLRLDPDEFQDLCRDLLREEPSIRKCSIYGIPGQGQHGIDLIAYRKDNDGIEVGECKREKSFGPSDIEGVVDRFFGHWDSRWSNRGIKRFHLFVACSLEHAKRQVEIMNQTQRFKEYGIAFEVWDMHDLRAELRSQRWIVEEYASRFPDIKDTIINAICGEASSVAPLEYQAIPNPAPDAAFLVQLEKLTEQHVTHEQERFETLLEEWREGKTEKVIVELEGLKKDQALPASLRARVLCFEAGIHLQTTRDINHAKQLADEAYQVDPNYNQARIRSQIAYWEGNPDLALQLLEGQQDIDSLHLKAAILIELGRLDEALDLTDFTEDGSE